MNENEKMTLLNCPTKEFLKKMNALRHDIADFFKKTKVNEILYKNADVPKDISGEEKDKFLDKFYAQRYDDIISSCFGENIDMTYELLAKVGFTTVEEIEKLEYTDVLNLLIGFLTNSRTMPFFITWRSTGLLNSGG